ncbi:MAG: hypothetical protein SFW67_30115 [Myxococcaceae bacterium]|nr:hypothetical protein [Myxococcaceae bacterium]
MRRLALALLVACAPKPAQLFTPEPGGETDAGAPVDGGLTCRPTCLSWTTPRAVGTIRPPVVELSGLVASRSQPVLYAHNDSGDAARFFALSVNDGAVLQEFAVTGATNVDWEDMALGPCATGTCLYLGDIGDNRKVRTNYAVYRVPEPVVQAGAGVASVPAERLPYEYPNGEKHNAEALIADPASGRLYVITKEDLGQPSLVFRFPATLVAGAPVTLERVTALAVPTGSDPQLTGADVSPCGDAVLVRLYNRLLLFTVPEGAAFEALFSAAFTQVPVAQEPQGEAVAFSADGRSLFTASEALGGDPPLFQSTCR